MDKNEAKKLLLAYRDDLSEVDNAEVNKALKMADEDPELKTFLAQEQAFDRAFTQKLNEIEPPSGLLDRILAEAPDQTATAPTQSEPQSAKIIWWQHPGTWSAAACVLALIALTAVFTQNNSNTTNNRADLALMHNFAQAAALHSPTIQHMDFQNNDIGEIGTYLAKNNSPRPQDLPENMDQLLGMGCLTYTWQDNPVGVICLKGEKVYNLYVANRGGIDLKNDHPSPFYKQFGNYSTALWTTGDLIYVLTVEGKEEDLSPLL